MSNRLSQCGPAFIEVLENRMMFSASPAHHPAAIASLSLPPAIHVRRVRLPASLSVTTGAADPIFMQIPGINGDVTTVGFENDIAIQSLQWGVHRTVSRAGSGAGAGKVSFSDLVVSKLLDKSSPLLLQDAMSGKSIPKLTIFLTRPFNETEKTYYQITLSNVMISGYSASSGGDQPTESVSLNFTKVQTVYFVQNTDGITTEELKAGWNLKTNKAA